LEDGNNDLQDKIKVLNNENDSVKDSLQKLKANLDEVEDSKSSLQEQYSDLQKLHEASVKENTDKFQQFQNREILISETTANLHERIAELQSENEDLASVLLETSELLTRTKEANAQLEEAALAAEDRWNGEKRGYLLQLEELGMERSRVEATLQDVQAHAKLLECDLVDQKAYTAEQQVALEAQLEVERQELQQLQTKLGDLVYEKSQLHMQIGHLEAQMKVVKCESDETKAEADKLVANLSEQVDILTREKKQVGSQSAELMKEKESLQASLEKCQSELASVLQRCKASEARVAGLMAEITSLQEDRTLVSQQLEDAQMDRGELEVEVAKLSCRIKGNVT